MADGYGVSPHVEDLTNEKLMDLINVTTANLGKGQLSVVYEHHSYDFIDAILTEDKVEKRGVAINGRIQLDATGQASIVDPYEPIEPHVPSSTYPFSVPWRHFQTNWSYERHEILENAGSKEKLYDYAKLKRIEAYKSLCDFVEEAFWGDAPADPTTKALWGLKAWCAKYEGTTDAGGFYGGNPSGWSDLAGINAADSGTGTSSVTGGKAKWRNYCHGYSGFNATFLEAMVRTWQRMKFKAPVLFDDLPKPAYNKFRIYCNMDSWLGLWKLQKSLGDDNGGEIGRLANGTLTLLGTPIRSTDCLDDDTDDPFYFTNTAEFKPQVLSGDYLRRTGPFNDRLQPDVFTYVVWLTVNLMCTNRRSGVAVVNKY